MTALTLIGVAAQFALIWRIRNTVQAWAEDQAPRKEGSEPSVPSP